MTPIRSAKPKPSAALPSVCAPRKWGSRAWCVDSSCRTAPRLSEEAVVLWWIGNLILLLVVVPVAVALLNRVLAAIERIRKASDEILTGGVAVIGELDTTRDLLATTDETIEEVADGAVRYAGSVGKLLG